MLQEQPAYQGEANAVCVNKRPQGRNGYGGWQSKMKKTVRLLQQSDGAPRFGKHGLQLCSV